MIVLSAIGQELVSLFIDDEFLAVAIIGVVIVASALSFGLHAPSHLVGVVLLVGCVAVLVASAYRGVKASK